MALTLHYHPLSSYCWKALIALYETRTPFEPALVDLGDPQARAAFLALWPTGKMPLLVDDGRVIPESSIVVEYVDSLGSDALLPADPKARLEARLWDRLFDAYVMTPMQAIVADHMRPPGTQDAGAVESARGTLRMAYDLIDRHMETRRWPAGDRLGLADCAAAPALFYAVTLEPFAPGAGHLGRYFDGLMQQPSVARTIAEARPYFDFYPFNSAIAPRFR